MKDANPRVPLESAEALFERKIEESVARAAFGSEL